MPVKKGYLIDVQGTLIDDKDKKPIAGSLETIRSLYERGIPFVLVTNNTKQESDRFMAYLRDLGFLFDDEQYLDPLMVLGRLLPPTRVAAFGSDPFVEVLERRGYETGHPLPEAILVAIRHDYDNDDYAAMIEGVLSGAKLIGMHETSIYAKNGRRYPGVGAILKMVSFATGRGYDVVGKPSRRFYEEALRRLRRQEKDIEASDVTMISDDLIGDLRGAKAMGMQTILVLSGKIGSIEEVGSIVHDGADRVVSDIGALDLAKKRERV